MAQQIQIELSKQQFEELVEQVTKNISECVITFLADKKKEPEFLSLDEFAKTQGIKRRTARTLWDNGLLPRASSLKTENSRLCFVNMKKFRELIATDNG